MFFSLTYLCMGYPQTQHGDDLHRLGSFPTGIFDGLTPTLGGKKSPSWLVSRHVGTR